MRYLKSVLLALVALGFNISASYAQQSSWESELKLKQEELNVANATLLEDKDNLRKKELNLREAQDQLVLKQRDHEEKKSNYTKLNNMNLSQPGIINQDALTKANNDMSESFVVLTEAQNQIKNLNNQITVAKSAVNRSSSHALKIEGQVRSLVDKIVNSKLQVELNKLKEPRLVKAKGRATCTEEESIKKCKSRAKTDGQRKATEQGGIISINSVTPIENLQISEDLIKSEVSADLINQKVLFEGWAPDSQNTWEYSIEATIVPRVSRTISDQLKANFERELLANVTSPVQRTTPMNPIMPSYQTSNITDGISETTIVSELDSLSKKARVQIEAQKFFAPINDNAFSTYIQMQKLNSSHFLTNSTVNLLASKIAVAINDKINQSDYIGAKTLYDQADAAIIAPDSARNQLAMVGNQLRLMEQSNQSQKELRNYLNLAADYLNQQRYLEPKRRNAHHFYVEALKLDSTNAEALAGLETLQDRILQRAKRLADQDQKNDSLSLLADAVKAFPQNYAFKKAYQEVNDEINKPKPKRKIRGVGW